MPVWEAWAHTQVAWYQSLLGRYEQARPHCEVALTMARGHGDRELEATTLDNLGYLAHHAGRYVLALDHYQQALGILRDLGHDYHEADTLERVGHTHDALGHDGLARASWLQALELCQVQRRDEDVDRIHHLLDDQPTSRASESCDRPETPSLR